MPRVPVNNGAVYDKYEFTQNISEVTVTIKYPSFIKGKDVICTIKSDSLLVKIKNETFIDGKLSKTIKASDSYWTVEDHNTVVVTLTKMKGLDWWSCVIVGDEEIDTQQIKPEAVSDLSQLDDETRDMVKKMSFDQHQRDCGLPTTDELKKRQALEQLKAAHPEMDFSNANII